MNRIISPNRVKLTVAIMVITVIIFAAYVYTNRHSSDNMRTVAIATLVSHPALDGLKNNIISELESLGYKKDVNIKYVEKNANGQMQLLSTIANDIASINPDVTISITTPVTQAIVNSVKGPIVFSAVSDPVGAGIIKSVDTPSENITGATDAWPYDEQLKLIQEITPSVKKLGVIFNPSEAPSQYGMRQIRKFARLLQFEIIDGPVNTTSEVYTVAQNIIGKCDAIYLSSDSTAIGGVAAALRIAIEQKKPLYVGDSGTVKKGGLAAVSIGYDDLGRETGRLVAQVLQGKHYIPVENPKVSKVVINIKAAKLMGVTIPQQVLKNAEIIDEIIE